jgi:hypothetical protein
MCVKPYKKRGLRKFSLTAARVKSMAYGLENICWSSRDICSVRFRNRCRNQCDRKIYSRVSISAYAVQSLDVGQKFRRAQLTVRTRLARAPVGENRVAWVESEVQDWIDRKVEEARNMSGGVVIEFTDTQVREFMNKGVDWMLERDDLSPSAKLCGMVIACQYWEMRCLDSICVHKTDKSEFARLAGISLGAAVEGIAELARNGIIYDDWETDETDIFLYSFQPLVHTMMDRRRYATN